jgi:hypothetical protein
MVDVHEDSIIAVKRMKKIIFDSNGSMFECYGTILQNINNNFVIYAH